MLSTQAMKKVKFDAGGKVFSISLDTLLAAKGSMFEALFREHWGPQAGDDGTIFIDRTPEPYDFIFDYLRARVSGEGINLPTDEMAVAALKKEAEFLCFTDLIEDLKKNPPPYLSGNDKSSSMGRRRQKIHCPTCHNNEYYQPLVTWNAKKRFYQCYSCGAGYMITHH
ncbi:uncharacterized protein EV422DRAFT_49290 [Fimicolochytrium jonesii]|uniref:uncharacterized protein n=1 Tax=Fimicolochytrium jonesii TaxID=1396493 RepID=UPI0022FEAE95|nr:uncharacterized protein EV422DRAFT_49290 [Fimicolochytrium jonesii]KAI8821009.1 hypothetical protein EV422DRAFT_49290 [Fimicolochytrium jonesii]